MPGFNDMLIKHIHYETNANQSEVAVKKFDIELAFKQLITLLFIKIPVT